MLKRKSILLLFDIANAADKIITYTNEMTYVDFIDNDITIDAVIRNYQIIAEAARQTPKQLRDDSPQINWNKLIRFRKRLAPKYFQINLEAIWKIRQKKLGELVDLIETLKNELIAGCKENYYD